METMSHVAYQPEVAELLESQKCDLEVVDVVAEGESGEKGPCLLVGMIVYDEHRAVEILSDGLADHVVVAAGTAYHYRLTLVEMVVSGHLAACHTKHFQVVEPLWAMQQHSLILSGLPPHRSRLQYPKFRWPKGRPAPGERCSRVVFLELPGPAAAAVGESQTGHWNPWLPLVHLEAVFVWMRYFWNLSSQQPCWTGIECPTLHVRFPGCLSVEHDISALGHPLPEWPTPDNRCTRVQLLAE